MSDIDYDKRQRRAAYDYILGPLYDPEPSQVAAHESRQTILETDESRPLDGLKTYFNKDLPPTPPDSPLSRPRFFSRLSQSSLKENLDPEPQSPLREFLLRRNSSRRLSRNNSVNSKTQPPQPTQQELISLLYTSQPARTRWNQGTILSRANSVAVSNPTNNRNNMAPPRDTSHRRGQSLNEPSSQSRHSTPADQHLSPRRGVSLRDSGPVNSQHILDQPIQEGTGTGTTNDKGKLPHRERSLRERYPGDMSHRPLDMIKKQNRAADRAPHLHSHRRQQPRDTIDTLDRAGPLPDVPYHHSGPFDPVLASRNTDPKSSPLEAVKHSNAEALRATPAAHVRDSLIKRVPLQGTAIVPPGHADFAGQTMDYEEGADLMREPDAAGGAYKRWDHVVYLDGDLKGKGEPSYTYEKDLAARKAARRRGGDAPGVEMQPRSTASGFGNEDAARMRYRSVKPLPSPPVEEEGGEASDPFADSSYAAATTSGIERKGIVGSIKRKIGSLRRK